MRFLSFRLNAFFHRLFLFVLVSIVVPAKAQQISETQLPVILPPAPNAGELGKYGNIPINYSTGSPNYNIPLLNVASGALKLNIALAYNSGGIKVDQIASRAGLGWILDAGGVINRTIYGEADEIATTAPVPDDVGSNTPEVIKFLDRVTLNKDGYDTQPDIFSFNFNGYSGKFILDPEEKSKVVFLNKSNLKVLTNFKGVLGQEWTIKVTDPNGVCYYFGGMNATEKSRSTTSGRGCGKSYDLDAETAWYLNKIEDLNGDNILLNYSPVQVSYIASASQTKVEQTPETRLLVYYDMGLKPFYPYPGYQSDCVTTIINTGVVLDKIVSSKGVQVLLTYIDRFDITGDKLISKLEYGIVGKPFAKTFNLDYSMVKSDLYYHVAYSSSQNNYRPYLVALNEWSEGLLISKKHEFHYNNANLLPPRLAYAQDHFGFFNGKNNFGFLPSPPRGGIFSYTPADRKPDGIYGVYGVLSKIIYPTKGTDSLVYEPNTIQKYIPEHWVPNKFTEILQVVGTGRITPGIKTKRFSVDKPTVYVGLFTSYSGSGVDDGIHQRATLEIKKIPEGTTVFSKFLKLEQSYIDSIALGGGEYEMVLSADGAASFGHAYVEGSYGSTLVPASSNTEVVGGVRIKNLLTYDPASNSSQTKSYSYSKFMQPNISSGVLMKADVNYFSYSEMRIMSPSRTGAEYASYMEASSSGDISLFSLDGNHILYNEVTESDGLGLANGGIHHVYEIGDERGPGVIRGGSFPHMPYSVSGYPSVQEKYQLVFRKDNNQVVKLKETFMTYKNLSEDFFTGYQGRRNYDIDSYGGDRPVDLAFYSIRSYWNYNDNVKVITYDEQGLKPMVLNTEYLYQNPSHLQLTGKTYTASDGVKLKNRLLYPHDMVSLAKDPSGVYASMIAKNKITVAVEESTLKGEDQLISLKRTNYFEPYTDIFVPQSIELFNPVTNLNETRIRFNKYNLKGNVLNLSMEDGMKIGYLWSYNQQHPIAEIKGADQATIESTLGASNIQDFSNLVSPDKTEIDRFLAPLRTPFPNAHISSFVFEPLKGMTSQTDAKGLVTYYEYDGFQRLRTVKDQEQNIIKNYQYNYKQ